MATPPVTDHQTTYAFQVYELHIGIAEFLGGRLSFADLQHTSPTCILEVGSGSGAWIRAIQAAQAFPQANVIAIDQNPIPRRPLPTNLEFRKVDITQPFPFEDESFDIVHARLVIMHVNVLRRAIRLVKPGGWLLVEDPDDDNMQDGGKLPGPGVNAFLHAWLRIVRVRGAEPCIGRNLERILLSSGVFEEVNVRKVVIPISGNSTDPALNKLGLAWKVNIARLAKDLPQRFANDGITEEVARGYLEEVQDPMRSLTTDFYFVHARKRHD
ncbi:S-adenosyl-L-methionine-dependent methyltransferase [Lenzites betulinus]|nr:S-adenosyl-L-methionine-dependent methyltransferase [Lenzites betulinus]